MNKKRYCYKMLQSSIDYYKALINMQANTPSFLDSPNEYKSKANENYGTKPKVKKLLYRKKITKKQ